jgi:CubicO group peptidase (beta-lactamase class C family)
VIVQRARTVLSVLCAGIVVACAVTVTFAAPRAEAQAPAQTPAAAPAADAARRAKIDAVFAEWDSTASPGCSVAISRDGALDYARGYGMSNLEHDIAIGPESIFHVASISKQFTAFSVALLAKEGKLSLDDAVRKYVPELPDYGTPVTIRHLIHHTSGLRDQWALLDMAGWRDDDLITEDDVLKIVVRQKSLNFKPGAEYLYSNTGYTLLAVIVKRVSGQSLRAFAEARIFKPLGMADTHFHDDHTEIVRHRTSAYRRRAGGGWSVSIPVFDTYGATSLFTTTGDLLKWEQNFVDARVGGRELIDEVQQTAKLNDGSDSGYATGLAVGSYRGLRTVSHSGADAGYRADVVRFPDQRLAIVALCNGSVIAPGTLTRKVAEVYLGDRMTPAPPAGVTVPETELTALAGVYWNETTDQVLRVAVKDGRLGPAAGGPSLVPLGGGAFRVGESATEWRFPAASASASTAAATGAPQELRIATPPLTATAVLRRLTPATPSAAALAALAGDYKSEELFGVVYSVAVANGKLIVRQPKQDDVTLEAVTADRFTAPSFGTVTFTHAASGQVDGVTFSSGRVRRLRFERVPAPAAAATAASRR